MDLCAVLQIYIHMTTTHLDTPRRHVEIAEGGQYLSVECDKIKEKRLDDDYAAAQKKKKEKEKDHPKPAEPKKDEAPQKTAVGKSKVE